MEKKDDNQIDFNEKSDQKPLRTVKSFVKRTGRLTKGQKRSLDELSKDYLVSFSQNLIDLDALFETKKPVVIEIGFGMGDSLCQMAKENPEMNYLGIEVHEPGVGNLLSLIHLNGLTNLKVIMHDAVDVLKEMIQDQSISGFQIFFPDPWHKKRHHKRRLIQDEFVNLLVKKLVNQGFIHCATDWEHYAEQMLLTLSENHMLDNRFDGFASRPKERPLTKFEKRGEKLSHGVWDLIFDKN